MAVIRKELTEQVMTQAIKDPRTFLRHLFDVAVQAAQPDQALRLQLPTAPSGRTIVVGAGKAAASMAQAFEQQWNGSLQGLVVTRYGHAAPTQTIEVVEAAHPVPDDAGKAAGQRMLELARSATADDLVVCLISGGASSLLAVPATGISLEDKQAVARALLHSGANIREMNCVRKHLSAIKGGQLAAAAAPARVVTLSISDVPGDDPAVVGSGPTVADPTTFEQARAIMQKYAIDAPATVQSYLQQAQHETPKPGDAVFENTDVKTIANAQHSLQAAADAASVANVQPMILSDCMEGEARDIALAHAGIVRQIIRHGQPIKAPCVLLSGGETTVTVRGNGRGGRNAEFLLALAAELDGLTGVYATACDTDGIDGTEDNAGAIVEPDTLSRAQAAGVSAKQCMLDNNGYGFFEAADSLILTGPTLTNVNDFRAIYISPDAVAV